MGIALDGLNVPAFGERIWWAGQEYEVVNIATIHGRKRVDTEITWRTTCRDCGKPVPFKSGTYAKHFRFRCAPCNGPEDRDAMDRRAHVARARGGMSAEATMARKDRMTALQALAPLRLSDSMLREIPGRGTVLDCWLETADGKDGERQVWWPGWRPKGDEGQAVLATIPALEREFNRLRALAGEFDDLA